MSSPISATAPASTPWSAGSGAISCSSPDRDGPGRVGRDGRLEVAFERRGPRTVLTARRFALPLQALEPVDLDGTGVATLYLLNPTGGILGGDVLDTRVTIGPGAHVCLTTPSATRVYRAAGPASVQRLAVRVGAGAVLEYVPDHLIPSPGARLVQTVAVDLAPGALALLLDAWTPGRVVRGETWRFDRLDLTTTVGDRAGPIFHDRVRLAGPSPAAGADLTEGRPYLATFAALGAGEADWAGLARALGEAIAGSGADLLGGAGSLGRGGVVAKVLARSAPDLRVATDLLWRRSRALLLGMPALDLRKL